MRNVRAEVLRRAAEIMGGLEPLRQHLRVPMWRLADWIAGREPAPTDAFLKAVDLVGADGLVDGSRLRAVSEISGTLRNRSTDLRSEARFVREYAEELRGTVCTRRPKRVNGSGSLEGVLEEALAASRTGMGNVQLFRPHEGLRIVAQRGFGERFLEFFAVVADGHSACGAALARGERVVVEDVASDPIFRGTEAREVMLEAGARAVQSTPLVNSNHEFVGMLSTHHREPRLPSAHELAAIDVIAHRAALSLERASS